MDGCAELINCREKKRKREPTKNLKKQVAGGEKGFQGDDSCILMNVRPSTLMHACSSQICLHDKNSFQLQQRRKKKKEKEKSSGEDTSMQTKKMIFTHRCLAKTN
ncbi:hypothetical protein NE237_016398 [Protea cynaroides]|uniref:Uncharacterized protein n=1 Tax=Protea cynaroides TaxID=273540 RepID=A0A9Q0K5G7_9MAGN|nr:hypothetical protein NE237_016398 [Protea cynaroides]